MRRSIHITYTYLRLSVVLLTYPFIIYGLVTTVKSGFIIFLCGINNLYICISRKCFGFWMSENLLDIQLLEDYLLHMSGERAGEFAHELCGGGIAVDATQSPRARGFVARLEVEIRQMKVAAQTHQIGVSRERVPALRPGKESHPSSRRAGFALVGAAGS